MGKILYILTRPLAALSGSFIKEGTVVRETDAPNPGSRAFTAGDETIVVEKDSPAESSLKEKKQN